MGHYLGILRSSGSALKLGHLTIRQIKVTERNVELRVNREARSTIARLREGGDVMPDVHRPDWLTELIGVVQLLCPQSGTGEQAPRGRAKKIGQASADLEHGPGWFWIGLAGQTVDSDQLELGCLAPAEGPEKHRFQLIESLQEGNVLKVRVGEHAPAHGLYLWIPGRPPGLLEKSLLDGLSRIDRFDLVNRFAEGRADPAAFGSGDAQARARAACTSTGVHLVWGPPGTGKTTVIAQALQQIVASGKSVLLVSATNIAVDNAVARAATAIRPQQGVIVRTGAPHLRDVAENPAVCLQKIVQDRQQQLEQQRLLLVERISARKRDPDISKLAAVQAELDDYDPAAYSRARDRVRDAKQLATWSAELAQLREQTEGITAAADGSDRARENLEISARNTASAREELARADALGQDLDAHMTTLRRVHDEAAALTAQHDRLTIELAAAQERKRFGNRHLKTLVRSKRSQLDDATAHLRQLDWFDQGPANELRRQIEQCRRRAHPHTPEALARLDAELRQARDNVEQAAAALSAHYRRLSDLEAAIARTSGQPQPTADELELVARAHQQDLPGKFASIPELRQRAEGARKEIAMLEDQHDQVITRMRKEAWHAEREIISQASVVAATLARLRMRAELHEREYDYVIIDEVAFACVPEVVYAASRARQGVTLLGDFLQNGPIPPDQFRPEARLDQPVNVKHAIQRWYQQDSFALFGIRDAASAQANAGCVTLSSQHRFGPVITQLANDVAYHGVLRVASPEQTASSQREVVLIDVDGLGDELAAVRRVPEGGRWWPVGALVACALAASETVQVSEMTAKTAGIVVPYRAQQEVIQSVLTESEANPQIEVGTSHRFQGREFDTVVFDLVEDGSGPEYQWGWAANGRLGGTPRQASGLRMVNVGITRAKRRLYLIANRAAMERASAGPLRAVQGLLSSGQIHVVRAADVLGMPKAPADDPVAGDVWQALRGYATLVDLYDEDHLPDELCRRIDEAHERIWLWSPWVGRRSEQMLPHLTRAQDRGVRVHAVVLPRSEVTRYLKPRHEELANQIAGTIYLRKEHQKIIVIDRHLTFIGSMNVLAHAPGSRHEVMALFRSKTLAERILEHERVDELVNPPTCQRCATKVRYVRIVGRQLTWVCTSEVGESKCGWTRAFRDALKGRNQPPLPEP